MDTSIAIDSRDKVHISYLDSSNVNLKYTINISGAWMITTIDSDGQVGGDTSIAIDSQDNVHISYHDYTQDTLKYATNALGLWETTTVDSDGNVGEDTSIAVDAQDKIHISYHDYTQNTLKYATNASGVWSTKTVDSNGWVGEYNSIAVDAQDKVHISYFDDTLNDLKYATNACEPESMNASMENVKITQDSSEQETITIFCENGTPVMAELVAWKVKKGKETISVTPESAITDVNGQAVFTITGVKKGKAKVEFVSGNLKAKVKVKVTE